jgi:hypothetical protein
MAAAVTTAPIPRYHLDIRFTDDASNKMSLVDRFGTECMQQIARLRGSGQADDVAEHVLGRVMAKMQAEMRKGGLGPPRCSRCFRRCRAAHATSSAFIRPATSGPGPE